MVTWTRNIALKSIYDLHACFKKGHLFIALNNNRYSRSLNICALIFDTAGTMAIHRHDDNNHDEPIASESEVSFLTVTWPRPGLSPRIA